MVKLLIISIFDIVVAPTAEMGNHLVQGICGQVDDSVISRMLGLEAGQSAFGDLLVWFRQMPEWPLQAGLTESKVLSADQLEALHQELSDNLLRQPTQAAAEMDPTESSVLAPDWMNGRRTPDANHTLKGALTNLTMGTSASQVFEALADAICYGSKQIVERFEQEGIPIKQIIGIGDVAKKSAFVMQTLADVLDRPIKITVSEQAPALGAAMYAASAAGIHLTTYWPPKKRWAVALPKPTPPTLPAWLTTPPATPNTRHWASLQKPRPNRRAVILSPPNHLYRATNPFDRSTAAVEMLRCVDTR